MHSPEETWFTSDFRAVKADAIIVTVQTDSGLKGVGEASPYGNPTLVRDWVRRLEPILLELDPLNPCSTLHPNGRDRSHDAAAAAIDAALWDLRGKASGKRIADLLSDAPLDRVRLYASGGCNFDWRDRPESLIGEVLAYADAGFTACKIRIGSKWAYDAVTPDRLLGLLRELTQELGGRMELMLDGNTRLTEDEALAIARGIDELGFTWFEEPIDRSDVEGYARLNATVGLPITGGEGFTTLEQFMPFFERGAFGIAQPDVAEAGITEAFRIAQAAARFGVDVCPHSWHNGLLAVEHAHYVAALPKPRVLELCMHQGPLQWAILKERPEIKDGWMTLPNKAGVGVEIADGLQSKFPYVEGDYMIRVVR